MKPIFHTSFIDIPQHVLSEVRDVLGAHAVRVDRDGAGPGSLTEEGLHYTVVDGRSVTAHAPNLVEWVRAMIPAEVQRLTGEEWKLSTDPDAYINVNLLRGLGERYEWHIDPNPLTVVVYVTGHTDGGEFMYKLDNVVHTLPVYCGLMVVMEGCKIPHAVATMLSDVPRISIPIELYQGDAPTALYSHKDAALYPRED